MMDIMTKQVFLPVINYKGQQGVFQYVQEGPVPTLTEPANGKKLVLVETVSQYRMRYVVECDEVSHAADEVVMERVGDELSQHHLGEVILSTREIDRAEYLRMFDEDNDYLRSWPLEKKFKMIHSINYDE
jgi:hypothetical protein